jgi:hypothetical protein
LNFIFSFLIISFIHFFCPYIHLTNQPNHSSILLTANPTNPTQPANQLNQPTNPSNQPLNYPTNQPNLLNQSSQLTSPPTQPNQTIDHPT